MIHELRKLVLSLTVVLMTAVPASASPWCVTVPVIVHTQCVG